MVGDGQYPAPYMILVIYTNFLISYFVNRHSLYKCYHCFNQTENPSNVLYEDFNHIFFYSVMENFNDSFFLFLLLLFLFVAQSIQLSYINIQNKSSLIACILYRKLTYIITHINILLQIFGVRCPLTFHILIFTSETPSAKLE